MMTMVLSSATVGLGAPAWWPRPKMALEKQEEAMDAIFGERNESCTCSTEPGASPLSATARSATRASVRGCLEDSTT